MPLRAAEKATGSLFGKLFPAYDDQLFLQSMELFAKRLQANNFPLDWFKGKKCLDVGCGGGRFTLAMAGLGAEHATGIDVAEAAVEDGRKRAAAMNIMNVDFRVGSVLELPFDDATFDAVVFSGVLMITEEPLTALKEIARVLKPGGMCYLLVYATEGVRWPLVEMLRPIAQAAGLDAMDKAIAAAGLGANRRRTYLDDLFVPYIDYYSWECLKDMLRDKGFSKVDRWEHGRLDHEENLDAYVTDLEGFDELMAAAAKGAGPEHKAMLEEGHKLCSDVVSYVRRMRDLVQKGTLTEAEAMTMVIGQGHHRVVAWKD